MKAFQGQRSMRHGWLVAIAICGLPLSATQGVAADHAWRSDAPTSDGDVVMKTVIVEDEDEDPVAAGRAAGEALRKAMGNVPLKAVILSECFEDKEYKQQLLEGVFSALPENIIVGGATYGSFTKEASLGFDSVALLGIGGDGIGVRAALVTDMGVAELAYDEKPDLVAKRLRAAGAKLAGKLPRDEQDRLMIIIADAHSPKNEFLVEGVQKIIGPKFPITGGSVNKNAGQTFVYFGGKMHEDSAAALILSGNFRVAVAGRYANDNEGVIRTAREGTSEALGKLGREPMAMLAFNCAGRRGKLDNVKDELTAIQTAIGADLPLFGCYCAGEIGPVDASEKKPGVLCGGAGWHVMVTMIGR
jgi:hypothetical protein